MSIKNALLSTCAVALFTACSSSDNNAAAGSALRPGTEDSSKGFKGTLSQPETDFWEAVRNADDVARQTAVAEIRKEVASDKDDGYGAFLYGANGFMPSSEAFSALAAGSPIPANQPASFPPDTVPLMEQALKVLEDPLYIGFDAALLAAIQLHSDPAEAVNTQAIGVANNIPASGVAQAAIALTGGDVAGARDAIAAYVSYCNGGTFDVENPDIDAFVDKANAAMLAHRECYSGYFAPHSTEGVIFILGDLVAATGNPMAAKLYYTGTRRASNYDSWPLRQLAERRITGEQPVKEGELALVDACATCHTNQLP